MFGWTHEDAAIELAAFRDRTRVFCIAGGGCTALRLAAAGHMVTAVDINPRQIEYVRERATGAPMREGWVETLMARARLAFPAVGWTRARLHRFLQFEDAKAQSVYWNRVLDTRRWQLGLRTLMARAVLRLRYAAPLVDSLPDNFAAEIRRRLARGFAKHPNCSNPYAWRMLMGAAPFEPQPANQTLKLVCADAAEFLENCAPQSFDAFSFSNIVDGAAPGYECRLRDAARRAGSPGAALLLRSFVERKQPNFAEDDRSLIWGTVSVETL